MWDVIVVGGGPAGISTALHLRHHAPALAARTLVLEKERYPRDKPCAGAIGARAFRFLERIGVTVDAPMVAIDSVSLKVSGDEVVVDEPGLGVVVRRLEFDHAFAREAMRRGIAVREGAAVTGLERAGDRLLVHLAGETLETRAVVGADGVAGIVRRAAGFGRGELRAQAIELDTPPVAGDAPRDRLVFDFSDPALNGYAWDFPTAVAGAPLVCRGVYAVTRGSESTAEGDAAAHLGRFVANKGLDASAYATKRFAERGFEPGAPISRPGVLLVGEAAGIDIATGEGIAQAIEYGEVAARYLADAFATGDLGFGDWLDRVSEHHVGWQLEIRHACFRVFFGAERPAIERLLGRADHLCRLGVHDFAGVPLSKGLLLRGVAQIAPELLRRGPGFVLRALERRRDGCILGER